jgi:hypothetical protein
VSVISNARKLSNLLPQTKRDKNKKIDAIAWRSIRPNRFIIRINSGRSRRSSSPPYIFRIKRPLLQFDQAVKPKCIIGKRHKKGRYLLMIAALVFKNQFQQLQEPPQLSPLARLDEMENPEPLSDSIKSTLIGFT